MIPRIPAVNYLIARFLARLRDEDPSEAELPARPEMVERREVRAALSIILEQASPAAPRSVCHLGNAGGRQFGPEYPQFLWQASISPPCSFHSSVKIFSFEVAARRQRAVGSS